MDIKVPKNDHEEIGLSNLRRSLSILGFSGMIERLKVLFSVIFEKMVAWCRVVDQGMEINCGSVVHQAA